MRIYSLSAILCSIDENWVCVLMKIVSKTRSSTACSGDSLVGFTKVYRRKLENIVCPGIREGLCLFHRRRERPSPKRGDNERKRTHAHRGEHLEVGELVPRSLRTVRQLSERHRLPQGERVPTLRGRELYQNGLHRPHPLAAGMRREEWYVSLSLAFPKAKRK